MQDKSSKDFEEKVREFLSTFGFQDVSGGPTFKIGGKQIDACGGIGETLLVVDATTTKSNIPSKIINLRGNIDVYKRMDVQKDGMPLEQYKKYKEVMPVVATKSLVDDKIRERAKESDIHVQLWDKQFFQYYDALKNLIKSYAKYQLYGELGLSSEPSILLYTSILPLKLIILESILDLVVVASITNNVSPIPPHASICFPPILKVAPPPRS